MNRKKILSLFAVGAVLVSAVALPLQSADGHGNTIDSLMSQYGGTYEIKGQVRIRKLDSSGNFRVLDLRNNGGQSGQFNNLNDAVLRAYQILGGTPPTATTPTAMPSVTVTPTTPSGVSGMFMNVPSPVTGKVSIEFMIAGATAASVDFTLSGAATVTHTEMVAPFEFIGSINEGFGFDSTTVPNGNYTLSAVAKDASGNVLTTGSVALTIQNMVMSTATVSPTPTNPASPTPTSPSPTATSPVPTATAGNFQPSANAPYCTDHDTNKWHGLWNSAKGCWYDHEHGDDPHAVDDVFGTQLWSLIGTGGEFGFPWQTYMVMPDNHIMRENDVYPYGKHQGYKWFVRKNVPCVSRFGVNCFTDMRVLVHFVGSEIDDNGQYHTALIEARACAKGGSPCGTILTGGWQDYGTIKLDGNNLGTTNCDQNNKLLYNNTGNRSFATWYPCGGLFINAAVETADHWDYFTAGALPRNGISLCTGQSSADNYNATENAQVYANTCGNDNSKRQLHGLFMINDTDFDGTNDGKVTYTGWVDRYGNDVTNCTAPAQDCVPFITKNLPVVSGQFQYRDDDMTFFGITLRDVAHPFNKSAVVGDHIEYDPLPSALKIKYPN